MTYFTKLISLWGFLISFTLYCRGQAIVPINEKSYTDSLQSALQKTTSDSSKARTFYLLSEYWRSKDTTKSKTFLTKGLQLAGKNPLIKALYDFYYGQLYFNRDAARSADALLKATKSLAPFHTKESYIFQSVAWFNYGVMKKIEKGEDFFVDVALNKAIPLSEKAGDPEKTAHYYSQIGSSFLNNAQFDKAGLYMNKAIDLLKDKYPNSPTLLLAYLTASTNAVYSKKKKEARVMLDKAKVMLAPYPESVNYPYYYYSEALYYTSVNQFDKVMSLLDKGITMATKLNQVQILQMLIFRKYNIYLETKNYKPAKELLETLLKNGLLTQDPNNRKMIYGELTKVTVGMGLMGDAYKWQAAYSKLGDSIHENMTKDKIAALEVKFRTAENQKKITILETENQKAILAEKNSRLTKGLLGAASVLLLIIAAFSIFYYRSNKKLLTQKEINHQQQLKEIEQQQRLNVTQAILTGEEKERTRVARDLHDGLGSMLAGVKINLSSWANNRDTPKHDPELIQIMGQLDQSVSELRHIARNMMPETLLKFGLEVALKDLCESLITKNLSIDFQAFNIEKNLSLSVQTAIYRIAQEVMTNAIKHAEATSIVLQCSQNGNTFFIIAEDNGIGFDNNILKNKTGMGLGNIQNRVAYLKGKIDIDSVIHEGTTVNIELHVA